MKRSDLIFASLLIPLDFVMLMLAGCAAYFLRFTALANIRPVILEIPFTRYIEWTILVSLFFIAIFALTGLYDIGRRRAVNEIQRLFTACSTGIMLVIVFIFFIQELFTSRFIVLAAWAFSFLFVAMGRGFLRAIQSILFLNSRGLHPVVIIGSLDRAQQFRNALHSKKLLGYRVVATYHSFESSDKSDLLNRMKTDSIEEIFVVDPFMSRDVLHEVIDFALLQHVSIRYAADLISAKRLDMTMVAGIPFIEIKRTRLEGWGRILKRLFDIIVSSILIVVLSPLLLIIALLVRLDSRGPIIYKNIRVGQRCLFPTFKFRSMRIEYCTGEGYGGQHAEELQQKLIKSNSERVGPVFKVLNDPRRTRIGRLLERSSLDELPQLFNVFLGNMSLVGPRPHMPQEVAGYEKHHHELFSVKPGITGLAQISGRSDLNFEDEARLDFFYIENWSFILDLIILVKTPFAVLARKSRV